MNIIKKLLFISVVLCTVSLRSVYGGYIITTIAGNGTAGYQGDGDSAASAQLNSPMESLLMLLGMFISLTLIITE